MGGSRNGDIPTAGFFFGKSENHMDDDRGYSYFRNPPYVYMAVRISYTLLSF